MRHAVFGKKLSRDINARKALLNNLSSAILVNGQVTTTLAKAKFAKSYIEKLVTLAKKNKLPANRYLQSSLTKGAFLKLINDVGPQFQDRSGGYTRIIKLNKRRGDAALMAKLEFIQWEKSAITDKTDKKTESKTEKSVKTTQTRKSAHSAKKAVSAAAVSNSKKVSKKQDSKKTKKGK